MNNSLPTINPSVSGPRIDTRPERGLSGNALKIIACISMLIDHAAHVFSFLLTRNMYRFLRLVIGRVAFPVYCFLLVEGFLHTRNRPHYAFRMLLFACIAEIPFDLAFEGVLFDWTYQNTMFTHAIGLLMLTAVSQIRIISGAYDPLPASGLPAAGETPASKYAVSPKIPPSLSFLLQAAIVGAAALLAWKCETDYGEIGIFCIAACYYLRLYPFPAETRNAAVMTGACLALNARKFSIPGAFLAVFPIAFYNGQRGRKGWKYAFYCFYPGHLLLLWLLLRLYVRHLTGG